MKNKIELFLNIYEGSKEKHVLIYIRSDVIYKQILFMRSHDPMQLFSINNKYFEVTISDVFKIRYEE